MTSGTRTTPELGLLITDFLADAEAGRAGRRYSRAELRDLRRSLTHVAWDFGSLKADELGGRNVEALGAAGLPAERVTAITDALRLVYTHAREQGRLTTSLPAGAAQAGRKPPTPTEAMLVLGERAVTWTMRTIVVAAVLVAVGLAVVLA